jgi:hypothetical protein
VVVAVGCSSDPSTSVSNPTTVGTAAAATDAPTSAPLLQTPSAPTATSSTDAPNAARVIGTLTATDLATQLSAAELAAANGDGSSGRRQQLLYRYLSAHPELDDAVLAGVADAARPYVERIIRARQFGQARQAANQDPSAPSDTLPAWTVVEPLPADELLGDYRAAQSATGIDWFWLAAIHLQETRMGRIIGTSSAGAVGPMQFLPSTWAACCDGEPTVARDAIIGAATYLAQSGGPADMQAALHVYNPSDTYVATVTAFAENMRDNPELYAAYREWQVFYTSAAGTVRLPVGYNEDLPINAAAYLARHPEDAG